MATESKKKVLVVTSSMLIARGLEAVFSTTSEFRVQGIISDEAAPSLSRIRGMEADVVILDPQAFDRAARTNVRQSIPDSSDIILIAIGTMPMSDEEQKQYDGVIDLYDSPVTIVEKMRSGVALLQDRPKFEGEELSAREKEILTCVAKGMLNKEIADHYNLSIYTVITHRKNITRKTGIKSVAGLTVYALLNNLIDTNNIE